MSLRVAKHIWHPQRDQHHTHMTAQRVILNHPAKLPDRGDIQHTKTQEKDIPEKAPT